MRDLQLYRCPPNMTWSLHLGLQAMPDEPLVVLHTALLSTPPAATMQQILSGKAAVVLAGGHELHLSKCDNGGV